MESKCKVYGTHQYFNILDPEACCFACGHKPNIGIFSRDTGLNVVPERKYVKMLQKAQRQEQIQRRKHFKRLAKVYR